jgi:hypothetical protein
MSADALDAEYENGVADVLAFLANDAAVVERNVQMPGAKSNADRQIDVKVTGRIFGAGNATMVVDCKRNKKSLDVIAVGAFLGLVEDVGADIGLLVTTTGASEAAYTHAKSVRGIRLDILPIETLAAWSPREPLSLTTLFQNPCIQRQCVPHGVLASEFGPSMSLNGGVWRATLD